MKKLYIEGTNATENGNLRAAFSKLLEKELKGNMPRIVMGDGISTTVDKFSTSPAERGEERFLLVDSDAPMPEDKQNLIEKLKAQHPDTPIVVEPNVDNSYFMVQEAEAWLMSQPDVLKQRGVNEKYLPKRPIQAVQKPSEKLYEAYAKSGKAYHKVSEFSRAFPLLDTAKLKETFPEFKKLIDKLK